MTRLLRTERADRGVVLPLTALTIVVVVIAVALTIDIGRASARIRELQSVADAVSLDLARQLDGRTKDEISSDATFLATVSRSTAANDFTMPGPTYDGSTISAVDGARELTVELGQMVVPSGGFEAAFTSIGGTEVPDAVKVTAGDTTNFVFRPGEVDGDRSGVAIRDPKTWIELGSVAAGFQPTPPGSAGIGVDAFVSALNAQLEASFRAGTTIPSPGTFGIDVLGYQGLAAAEVDLDDVAANAGFASADEMTESTMTAGQFFDATIVALQNQGDAASLDAATQLQNFRSNTDFESNAQMNMGDTVTINEPDDADGNGGSVVAGNMNVLDLLTLAAQGINGANLVDFQMNTGIPGVGVVDVTMATIEPAQRHYGGRNASGLPDVQTAQVRFQITATIAAGTVPGINAPINLPLVFEAGQAEASIDFVRCTEPLIDSTTQTTVVTSAAKVSVGTAANLQTPGSVTVNSATLIQAGNIGAAITFFLNVGIPSFASKWTASGSASLGGGTSVHGFEHFDPANQGPQRATGGVSANMGADLLTSFSTNAGASATSSLTSNLAPLFNQLSSNLLNPLQQFAGMSVGGADISMYEDPVADDCAVPALVE